MTTRNENLSGRKPNDHDSRIAARNRILAGYMYGMTRRDLMAASALGLLAGTPRLARAAVPQGQLTWAVHVSLAPTWFDPADTQAVDHAVHGALRAARRDGEADAGNAPGAVPRRIVADVGGRHDLGFHDPRRRQIPQRRAGDRRGRQVLVRALSRRQPGIRSRNASRRSRFPMRGTCGSACTSPGPIS